METHEPHEEPNTSTESSGTIEFDPNEVVDQRVIEAFRDYPTKTLGDINQLLKNFRSIAARVRTLPKTDKDYLKLQGVVETGNVTVGVEQIQTVDERPLNDEEKGAYQKLGQYLEPFRQENGTFANPESLSGETRFYVSLKDSQQTTELILKLTQELEQRKQDRQLRSWRYKFDASDGQNLRFDPPYRDKGASPILYVDDADVPQVNELLEELLGKYPEIFLPQTAPFKYSPHQTQYDVWHIAQTNGNIPTVKQTPEQGMRAIAQVFFSHPNLKLTEGWKQLQQFTPVKIREAWEDACAQLGRDPQRPYVTTDRPVPSFYQLSSLE